MGLILIAVGVLGGLLDNAVAGVVIGVMGVEFVLPAGGSGSEGGSTPSVLSGTGGYGGRTSGPGAG